MKLVNGNSILPEKLPPMHYYYTYDMKDLSEKERIYVDRKGHFVIAIHRYHKGFIFFWWWDCYVHNINQIAGMFSSKISIQLRRKVSGPP